MESGANLHSKHNWVFWFHLLTVIIAWTGPFLFSWFLMVGIYLVVLLQFKIYNRCLLNSKHDMDDTNATFYSYLLDKMGIKHSHTSLKRFVRRELYVILSFVAIIWQLVLGFKPVFF
jgi:hypothetical protein